MRIFKNIEKTFSKRIKFIQLNLKVGIPFKKLIFIMRPIFCIYIKDEKYFCMYPNMSRNIEDKQIEKTPKYVKIPKLRPSLGWFSKDGLNT